MTRPIYRFGDYRIDPSARELQHAGELVVLSPKVFDSLAYLIEHRDRAVGRDELIAAVWGKADVSDTLLGQTVLKARRAVGDTGNEQNAIRTVPRFGYRWVAPIQVDTPAETAVSNATPATEPTSAPGRDSVETEPPTAAAAPAPRRRNSMALAALAAVVAVLAAFGLWRYQHRAVDAPAASAGTAADGKERTAAEAAAVLPVEIGAGNEWTWLRLGLMDLIANRLRNAGQAVVPADNVVALARDDAGRSDAAIKRVREATGARLMILPNATRAGSEWVVHLLLRDPAGGDREVEARAADVIEAGRAATDRLLAVLGKQAPKPRADSPDAAATELLSRAESALLTDDLEGARRLLESAPADVQKSPELRLRLAQIDFRAGQFEHARGLLDALLKEVSSETDPVLRARILNGSGAVNVRQDKNAEAEHDFGEAIALLENREQPAALGQAYTGRGIAYAQQVRLDLAVADFSRARIALELAGDTLALARVEANEGIIDAKRGRYADALVAHERAIQRFERFGALNELILTLANATEAQLALLRPADALATSDRAWALLGRLENPTTRYSFQLSRVEALTENGRLLEARALLRELLVSIPHGGDPILLARAQTVQAQADLDDGQAASAIALATTAVAKFAAPDYLRERASAWLVLIRALRAQGHDSEAAGEVERFSAWTATITQVPPPLAAALAEAEQRWAERQLDSARAAYDKTLRVAEQQAVPGDIAEIVISYGSSLITDGELQRAAAVVGQVARWADRDFGCALLQVRLYRALGHEDAWRAALKQAQALAGERNIPAALTLPPDRPGANRRTAQILEQNQLTETARTQRE